MIEWFGAEEPLDPRFGVAMPPILGQPLLDVTHMAFGGAVVTDPTSLQPVSPNCSATASPSTIPMLHKVTRRRRSRWAT